MPNYALCIMNCELSPPLFLVLFFGDWHCSSRVFLFVGGYVFVMFLSVLFRFKHFSDLSHD